MVMTVSCWLGILALMIYDPIDYKEVIDFNYKSDYSPSGSWNITQHKRMGLIE